MAIRRRLTGEKVSPRRFYAFTDSVIDPGHDNPRLRLSLEFDAVDASRFDDPNLDESDDDFALIRVITTHKRLGFFGLEAPKEGDWLLIEVGKERNTPRAWVAPAIGGFVPEGATNAPILRFLSGDADTAVVERIEKACSAPEAKRVKAVEVLNRLNLSKYKKLTITALDVGQAACVAFADNCQDIGYFDIGKPISFNRRSFPKGFMRTYPLDGFVLLSHWDFDHFALAINNPSLMGMDWYAPDQKVGPYTARFQRLLGPRLHFITGDASVSGVLLKRCIGVVPTDRNATGYVVRFERDGEVVLLTGDADYVWIPQEVKVKATSLTMPHHGGKGTQPPKPAVCGTPIAVASYGKPNTYKHPDDIQVMAHRKKGWRIRRTAAHGSSPRIPRSDQQLYPLDQEVKARL